jgi:hypothetical protein
MIAPLLAALLLVQHGMPVQGAPGTNDYVSTPATRDADCFLIAAIMSQSLSSSGAMTPEQRQMEPVLRNTATYFAGRLSTRLSGDALRQALVAASPVIQSRGRGSMIPSCTGEYQDFIRSVRQPASGE